jgi:hypothetical protein
MKLGIPTFCRYDLLESLLLSAEAGTVKPDGYIIIDNGNGFSVERVKALLGDRASVVELISPGTNIGVAAAWNRILEMTLDDAGVIISNDDIEFGPRTFEELSHGIEAGLADFVEGDGWALFGQATQVTRSVGWYDENFWPAYYEDVDYDERMRRLGVMRKNPLSEPVKHHGWATTTAVGNADWLKLGRERNHAYFLRKWGGESRNPRWNGNAEMFQFPEPFDGKPPPGWSLRGVNKQKEKPLMVMHWDVLNKISDIIAADLYLEIGVCDGSNMRQMKTGEKWGVDPYPQPPAVAASDVFVPKTSRDFFHMFNGRVNKFDLVFIDGDHRAEVVYAEVQDVLLNLSEGGVIVLHDCNPHTEAMQIVPGIQGEWTGDVWKAVMQLREEGHILRVINSDYGIGILIPSKKIGVQTRGFDCGALTWAELEANRKYYLGLIEPWEWEAWFRETWGNS